MGGFGLLPNDSQIAEQRRGKFFQHKKHWQQKLKQNLDASGKHLIFGAHSLAGEP
jgi:hypothetical protein